MTGIADRDDRGTISSRSTSWMILWTVVVLVALGFLVWLQHTGEIPVISADRSPAGVSSVEPRLPATGRTFVSPLGGQWYPREAGELNRLLDTYLAQAEAEPRDDVIALIVPHAGYEYSGATAAAAYEIVQCRHFSRVIVLGNWGQSPIYACFLGFVLVMWRYALTCLGSGGGLSASRRATPVVRRCGGVNAVRVMG